MDITGSRQISFHVAMCLSVIVLVCDFNARVQRCDSDGARPDKAVQFIFLTHLVKLATGPKATSEERYDFEE